MGKKFINTKSIRIDGNTDVYLTLISGIKRQTISKTIREFVNQGIREWWSKYGGKTNGEHDNEK